MAYRCFIDFGYEPGVTPLVVEADNPECAKLHTPCPTGYIPWFEWCEAMSKTHRAKKCPHCGRYAIWVEKPPRKPRKRKATP